MKFGTARAFKNNKAACMARGEQIERYFVSSVLGRMRADEPLEGIINPDKLESVHANDLMLIPSKQRAELKSQSTPFYRAKPKFGFDPQYVFTLNVSDAQEMDIKLAVWKDDPIVFFYVLYEETTRDYGFQVLKMEGVWAAQVIDVLKRTVRAPSRKERFPIHVYPPRPGNADDSFVLDLHDPIFYCVPLITGTNGRMFLRTGLDLVLPAGLEPATTR